MADNIILSAGTADGATVATEDTGGAEYQKIKLVDGTAAATTMIAAGGGVEANALRVTVASDSTGVLTVDGTVTANLSATDNTVLDNIDSDTTSILADTAAIQTAVETIDNAVHVDDAAFTLGTDSGQMIMGFAGTQSVNANDACALACETDGALHIHDGGNTITVDGTVTANLSATDNAVLDTIDADTSAILLDTAAMDTNLATIAGAVSTEMQCDIVAALPAGTNNIGDVDVLSQPARANTTDAIKATIDSNGLMNGTTVETPKFAVISTATSGNNELVAAVASHKIRVLSMLLVADGVVDVFLRTSSAGAGICADATRPIPLDNTGATGAGGLNLAYNPHGHFETVSGEALGLNLSGAVAVSGSLTYVEIG